MATLSIAANATEASVDNDVSDAVSMDALDILIATYRVLAATADDEKSVWGEIVEITSMDPLYDLDGEVVAIYLSFEPAGYVVVNNNRLNPVVMECSLTDYSE